MKIKLILLALMVAALGAGTFLYFNKGEKVSNNKQQVVIQPPPVEDFINQSALEVQNPQAGASASPAPAKENSTLAVICQGADAQNFDCYDRHYRNLAQSKGIPAAFADLRTRYEQSSYVVTQCHPLTHVIGQAAIEKYPTASEAYQKGDSFCWSGFYHGALEGIMGKIGRANVVGQLNTICQDIEGKDRYSFDYYNCVHGIGHGLMAMTNTELFESLELCDNLAGSWEQTSCYGGVYMENVIVDNKNHFTKYLKPDDPLYPCNAVDHKYKSACYLMQTSYVLKVTNGDFSKAFSACEQADKDFVATCFQSLGRDASGRSASNIETTKQYCMLGNNFDAQSNCVIGAVKDFISYFHSDVQAKQFCVALDVSLQPVCMDTAAAYYKSF